jgi:hypothetical protein
VTATQTRLGPAELNDVLGLMLEVTGRAPSEDELEWLFERNPAGTGLVSSATEHGQLAGVIGTIFAMAVTPAGTTRIAFPVNAVTKVELRRHGIFSALELRSEELAAARGATLGIAFPNVTRSTFVSRLGWTDVASMRIWARVLHPLRLLRRAGGGGFATRSDADIERFESVHEEAWLAVQPAWGSCVARSVDHLNWRYLDSPRGYRVFGVDGCYAVVRHIEHKRVSAAAICELVGPPRAQRRLLRRCLHEARSGADVALGVPAAGQRAAYAALGFMPTPIVIRVVGKSLSEDVSLPRSWFFSLGDTDFI